VTAVTMLQITQNLLAEMLGVQRPTITNAARELEHAGVIARGRRQVTILDRQGLRRHLANVISWSGRASLFTFQKPTCNAAFLRMLGIEREEHAIGKELHDAFHHTRPDGSHYPKEECPIYRTAQGGDSAHVDNELFFGSTEAAFL
jgi:Crp-like helix-turn-helix domain